MDPMVAWETEDGEEWVLSLLFYVSTVKRKPPEKFFPSMQGNKYEIALAQITACLGKSKNSLAFAQMSVKLMNKGDHRRADCWNGDGSSVT